jgi:hypothetical protein
MQTSVFTRHAKALHGNPFDGHTLGPLVPALEALTGVETQRIHVDKGYRGHNHAHRSSTSGCRDNRARSLRIQLSSSATNGAMRVVRTARRCSAGNRLISPSIAKIASIRRTAATASGALATSPGQRISAVHGSSRRLR